jgi:tRNA(Ser,Leu) C12 N-acetylase TAN1
VQPWNVLATSFEGHRDQLLTALRRLGNFRGGGYRNILVGHVPEPAALLDAVRAALTTDRLLATSLAKVVPIEVTVRFDSEDAAAGLAPAAEPFLDRLGGGSFFVRVERRGLKGKLVSPTVEREVADRVWRALEARGHVPRVAFTDPDHVLAIETLGENAGLALLSRALRRDYEFVRVR